MRQITSERPATNGTQGWLIGACAFALVFVFYLGPLKHLAGRWSGEADYSHGFLVIPFALYLLWHRRHLEVGNNDGGRWMGFLLLLGSAAMRFAAAYYSYPLADAFSLLPCIAGVALLLGGWSTFRWSWPAIAFLVFMIPLPGVISERMSGPLQRTATICGTYLLQTVGIPAVAIGNVIHLSEPPPIEVVEACSGLRMLICFLAITFGAAFVTEWGVLERLVIVLSGIPIAVASNVLRIASTGMVQDHFGPEVASKIFHDFAGWMMMPIACAMVALELWMLQRALPPTLGDSSTPSSLVVERQARPATSMTAETASAVRSKRARTR